MGKSERLVLVATVLLLLAGGGGLVAQAERSPAPARAEARPPTTLSPGPAPSEPATVVPPVVVPTPAALAGELIVPNDLGGYYTPEPSESASQLAGSGCLSALGRQPDGASTAHQFLQGPFAGRLPFINESLTAYRTLSAARTAFDGITGALARCRIPPVAIYGTTVPVALRPLALDPLGDQAVGDTGPYLLDGLHQELTLAVVRSGALIIVFVYADRVPASEAILGSVQSTLAAVVGKTGS